jgi:hypothetical protein
MSVVVSVIDGEELCLPSSVRSKYEKDTHRTILHEYNAVFPSLMLAIT